MATINQKIFDKGVSHQINVIDFSRSQALIVSNILDDSIQEIKKELVAYLHDLEKEGQQNFLLKKDQKKLDSLIKRINKLRASGYRDAQAELLSITQDFMQSEKEIQKDIIYGTWYDPIIPTEKDDNNYFLAMAILGRTYVGNFDHIIAIDAARNSAAIKYAVSTNMGVQAATQYVIGTQQNNYTDGVMNTGKNQLSALAASCIIAGQSAVISNYNRANSKKLIMYGQFVAILDSRTSAICQSLSGKVDKYEALPHPPLHPNCRSHIASFFKKIPDTAKSSIGGKPRETDYQQWLKKQPREVQEQVLGKTRTELLRSGKLNLDKFYSKTNDLYTLQELRNKYGVIKAANGG
jgi:SPP1 gp7 family putative phage head morphogenesis protein